MKILITAFEPFANRKENNSLNLLNSINDKTIDKLTFPVSVNKVKTILDNLDLSKYDLVIFLGEANIKDMQIEFIARNLLYMRIPDNDNIQIKNKVIIEGTSYYLKTTLDITKITKEYNISSNAGTYLCNYSYYLLLSKNIKATRLFIHIPITGDYTDKFLGLLKLIKEQIK